MGARRGGGKSRRSPLYGKFLQFCSLYGGPFCYFFSMWTICLSLWGEGVSGFFGLAPLQKKFAGAHASMSVTTSNLL